MQVLKQLSLLGVLMLGATTTALAAGMTIEPGDVLSVTVAKAPEIGRDEAKVDADGRIMLPVIGSVAVAGSDLDAIREKISDRLVAADLIREPAVTVEIARYRPFYVGGAVAHPGAIEFEPGLTVRHALILAGGLDAGTESKLTIADLVELKSKWTTNNYAMLEVDSRIARLEAELDHGPKPDFAAVAGPPVDGESREGIEALDSGLYDDRAKEFDGDQDHMRQVLALVELEIDVLTKQADLQNQERSLQQTQVSNARVLVEKGVLPLPRLQELEREASRLSRDLLDNQAYVARARQNKQSQQYTLDAADTKWRIEIRGELSQALLQRNQLKAQGEVLASALLAAGVVFGGSEDRTPEPTVAIHRLSDGAPETFDAGLDTVLRPGDVLEVSIKPVPAG